MALPSIIRADFTGWIKISADTFQAAKLQDYIDKFYPIYLRSVLGAEAVKDITDNAVSQKWLDILNGVYYFNIS